MTAIPKDTLDSMLDTAEVVAMASKLVEHSKKLHAWRRVLDRIAQQADQPGILASAIVELTWQIESLVPLLARAAAQADTVVGMLRESLPQDLRDLAEANDAIGRG